MGTTNLSKGFQLIHQPIEYWARKHPGKLAVIDYESGNQLMYHQLREQVQRLSLNLQMQGIGPGDRVVAALPLNIPCITLLYACARIGAIFVPLNGEKNRERFIQTIHQLAPRALFYEGGAAFNDLSPITPETVSGCASIRQFVQINDPFSFRVPQPALEYHRLITPMQVSWNKLRRAVKASLGWSPDAAHAWAPVIMLPPSREGIHPYPVVLGHENFLHQHRLLQQFAGFDPQTKCWVNQAPEDCAGLLQGVGGTLSAGGTVVLSRNTYPSHTLDALERHCITHLIQGETDYRSLLSAGSPSMLRESGLKFCAVSSGIPDADLGEQLHSYFPRVGGGLRLPEAGGYMTFSRHLLPESDPYGYQSAGMVLHPISPMSIREPMQPGQRAGEEIPAHLTGEICLHPPAVFLGYYGATQATGAVLAKEGLCYTGFQGRMEKKGLEQLLFIARHARKDALPQPFAPAQPQNAPLPRMSA